MIFKRVDVTSITGDLITGPMTSWQTRNGAYLVEHLAGANPNGELIVLWWSPQHDWQSVNVTQITGQKIAGPPTSWQSPNGPYFVEHLAAMSPGGDLVVFWWSSQHDWKALNVSQKTGQKIAGALTSWKTTNGPYLVEHLAAMSPNGDLVTFWWSSQHDWQSVNISRKTGQKIAGPLTSWQMPNGPYLVEHLAAMSPQNDLLTFWWSSQHDWQAVNVSQKAGQKIASAPTSWQTQNGPHSVEHLAAANPSGDLIAFWWSPQHDWQAINVSQKTGQKVVGAPASWQTREKGFLYEYLACKGPNDDLLVFWWSPPSDWQVVNNTAVMRQSITESLTAWKTQDNQYDYDHVAGTAPGNRVIVFWHSTKWDCPWAILMTTLKNQPANGPTDPATPLALITNFFTGAGVNTSNAVKYFSHMSHGNADLSKSRLIFVSVDSELSDFEKPANAQPGWSATIDEFGVLEQARQAVLDQGDSLEPFVADVLSGTIAAFATHGGVAHSNVTGASRGYAYGDHRYVRNNGTQSFGHEMGHGFGLDHSRADNPNVNVYGCDRTTLDYRDPWDKMSTGCDYAEADADYSWRGPGLNASNMRGRGWLDESRVWSAEGEQYDFTIELRPLHRADLNGWLAAQLPPLDNGRGRFLVEFRLKEEWDAAIPRSAVLVHRFDGNQSYILSGTNGNVDLVAGDSCAPWVDGNTFPVVQVVSIDEANRTATVRLLYEHTK
jgi:hypothetical protein